MTVKFDAQPEAELAAVRAEVTRLREELKHSERLTRELAEAVAARDAFIAVAGHELRNPMGALMIAATSLARRASVAEEPIPAWLAPRLAALERQARLFVRRATTLLDVSRISTGHLRLTPEVTDLSRVTLDAIEWFASEVDRSGSLLTSDVAPEVHGWWDAVALEQVVFNLVQNAIKYGAGKPIHVTLSTADGRATLTVRDEGIGISPIDRERIFARFERAVTQRTHGGFGLGLWITRELVEASGGTIRVESTPGAGSIFTVVLPQAVQLAAR
jgi:two-component system OmpR family sensor kinase